MDYDTAFDDEDTSAVESLILMRAVGSVEALQKDASRVLNYCKKNVLGTIRAFNTITRLLKGIEQKVNSLLSFEWSARLEKRAHYASLDKKMDDINMKLELLISLVEKKSE